MAIQKIHFPESDPNTGKGRDPTGRTMSEDPYHGGDPNAMEDDEEQGWAQLILEGVLGDM